MISACILFIIVRNNNCNDFNVGVTVVASVVVVPLVYASPTTISSDTPANLTTIAVIIIVTFAWKVLKYMYNKSKAMSFLRRVTSHSQSYYVLLTPSERSLAPAISSPSPVPSSALACVRFSAASLVPCTVIFLGTGSLGCFVGFCFGSFVGFYFGSFVGFFFGSFVGFSFGCHNRFSSVWRLQFSNSESVLLLILYCHHWHWGPW